MKINIYNVGLFLLLISTTLSCSKYSLPAWVRPAPENFVPTERSQVPPEALLAVDDEKVALAIKRLGGASLVKISGEEVPLYSAANTSPPTGRNIYLVRTINDGRNGRLSAYINKNYVVLLWGAFGDCTALHKAVTIFSTNNDIDQAYANCFGVD